MPRLLSFPGLSEDEMAAFLDQHVLGAEWKQPALL